MKLKRLHVSLKVGEALRPVSFTEAVTEYLEAQTIRLSPNTIRDYSLTLNRASASFKDAPLADITAGQIRSFLLNIPGKSKNKLNARIALCALWTWCIREGYANDHVPHRVETPRISQRLIVPFTRTEYCRLLDSTARMASRDRAIILILLDTGLRASELCGLTVSDLRGEYLKVLGKGNKEREVPVGPGGLRALIDYLSVPKVKPGRFLFTTRDGLPMNRNCLGQMIERLGDRAGVEGCHPHRFRHTFAVNYLLNGGDPYTLQKILGHSTLEMVRRYLALVKEDLARVHHKASPVENWGVGKREVIHDQ